MYRITYGDSVVFDPYDDDLSVTNAKMSAEINAASYLDFTISMRHPLYNVIKEHDQVVGLYFDGATLFLGVVDSIETDMQGSKSISCVSALDYLNDTVVRPYSTISGDGTLTAPTSIDGYFQWLIDQHNAHVMDLQKRFEIGVNQGGSLSRTNYITPSSSNYPTTADEIMSNILDAYGGYLIMRYDGDRKILDLYSDVHDMNPQIVDFGVNITDFTKTVSTESQYTALIPLGGSPSMDDGGFESGSYSEWVEHPDTPLVGSPVHQGSSSSYFTSGSGEYINKVCFYVKKGARYKATVWVKNERSSDVTVRFGYQLNTNGVWSNRDVANASMAVSNEGEWKEFSVDFMPDASENVGMRPRWYFDSVSEDGGKRVYVDDFDFRQINGDSDVDEDPISLKLIPDGIAPRNSDVAIEGESIYSIDAVREYGYREKTWSDDSITDVDALLESAIVQLNKSRNPEISVDVKAVDLALYMDGYDHLRIGQAVRVRSKIHGIDEYLMVSSIDLDLQDPGQTDYTLGISYDTFTGQQSSYLRMLNGGINSSLDQVTALDQTAKDQAIQIGSVEQVANQAQQTANTAQNTANNAQQTANANKEAIDTVKDKQSEQDKLIEKLQQGITDSEADISGINDRLTQMDSDIEQAQSDIDAVRQEAQTNFETAKNAADAAGQRADAAQEAVDSLRESTSSELQNVKDSVSGVRSDVDAVEQKAADLASELDGTKATVEQVTTDLGEVKTTVSNAATKADQALQVSTSASQTATEARTTATSAYQDAQSALTQSSVASQTANAVKTELETKYSTTDEIAEQYATKSLVEQTSQSITSTVEATYATKATVEALENIANNAVQTWMGSGVPTLSNKPASDWTTAELKSQHSGDIYYDTNTGYSYRFGSSDGKNYSWSLIKDTDISKAVADAAKAQQTAEGVSDEVTQLKTDIPATYATKTEVKQTTDSIKSSVSEVATTANSALSKATTVEQTAKGLQTTVTEQAKKLDGAVTTISQVSQRVDSVSSTITQVSGRVDDVEDKADTAQGTANSALSQASRVEQSLDSFKTSVSRDYQTKTDALSQKSELEQNLNSFKTTVSETYTTKDEFNALEIGGTNLLPNTGSSKGYGTSAGRGDLTVGTDDIRGEYYRRSTTGTSEVFILSNRTTGIDDGEYTVSFWYRVNQYVKNVDVFWLARSVDSSADYDTSGGAKQVASGLNPQDNTWTYWSGTFTAISGKPNGYIRIDNNGSLTNGQTATLDVTQLKLERGNKPTAWSPAPEDFDGKYTSKTEFKQTTDKISATATAASQNASSALSKISSLEVSVDGIDAKVEEVASDADEAVKTASQVSQRVDSLSSTITQVSGRVDDVEDKADTAQGTANSALSKSSSVEQNLNSFKTSVSQTYETKSDASSKQSSLQQSVNNLRTEVSETYTTKTDFTNLNNSAVKTYSFTTNVNSTGWYKLGTWSKTNQCDICAITIYAGNGQNARADQNRELRVYIKDGFQSTSSASGAFGVTIDRIRNADNAEVQVRATADNSCDVWYKADTSYAAGRYTVSVDPGTTWTHSGSFTTSAPSSGTLQSQEYQTYSTKSYVDQTSRTVSLGVVEEYKNGQHGSALATQSDITAAKDSITSTVSQTYATKNDVGVGNLIKNGDFSDGMTNWATNGGTSKIVDGTYGKQFVFTQTGTNTNGSNRIYNPSYNHINGQAYEVSFYAKADKSSKWHFGPNNSSKAASVTLDTTLKQYTMQYQADGTTILSIWTDNPTATIYLERVKLSVASGYYATKTEVKQTSDSLTVTISSAVSKAESAAEAAADAQNTANSAKKQRYNTVNASSGTTGYFRFATLKITQSYANRPIYFSLSNRGQKASNVWVQFNNVNSTDPSLNYIQADGGMNVWIHKTAISTWEMIAQKSEAYDTLIVDDYSNTDSKITVTWVNAFLSSVPSGSTQATRLASKRPSSDIDNAQSTANTANSNAQNAQNRVGNLETCIKMTSDGVRVGKISNGNFTGYSALVNSAGSFDVLDSSGKQLVSFGVANVTATSGARVPIANFNAPNIAFNGSPANMDFVTFKTINFGATSGEVQSLPLNSNGTTQHGITYDEVNSSAGTYQAIASLDSSAAGGKRVFISNYNGWLLVSGNVGVQQFSSRNIMVEGRWYLGSSIESQVAVSYLPPILLLHDQFDSAGWYRIPLPSMAIKVKKGDRFLFNLSVTRALNGMPPGLSISSFTYITAIKMPFSNM